MAYLAIALLACVAAASALPAETIIAKLDDGPRYQYVRDGRGQPHLVDLWLKASDVASPLRYNPDVDNVYHLFSRQNPSVSQPMLLNQPSLLANNFDPTKRTVVVMHGWQADATADVNVALIPSLLAAADVNVIAVDWSVGAWDPNYLTIITSTVPLGGASIARFITWLNEQTGASLDQYHIIGYSISGHQCGVVGRNLGGQVPYITSLDPSGPGWTLNSNRFTSTDAIYTEAIHTDVLVTGIVQQVADVDIYPNGGLTQPGCDGDWLCSHERSFYFMAESVVSGGFTAISCDSVAEAMSNNCSGENYLPLGGLVPKDRATGVFWLETNPSAPYSRG